MNPTSPSELYRDALVLDCRTACECGCNRPARVEIMFGGNRFLIADPMKVDLLVDELVKGRTQLWGPRPDTGGELSVS